SFPPVAAMLETSVASSAASREAARAENEGRPALNASIKTMTLLHAQAFTWRPLSFAVLPLL
ncbi:MAG: hypothetical protein IKO43_04630, partial [Kiritimatiellae bacterium]|nr:hypothetical protein [Kiritimatiellia bacterium]